MESWNSKVSWNVPSGPSYPQPQGDASRGYDAGYAAPPGAPPAAYGAGGEKVKDNSKKNMMMGAAAGVAVGAVGGMVVANALGRLSFLVSARRFVLTLFR
jgi:hypothetical protein